MSCKHGWTGFGFCQHCAREAVTALERPRVMIKEEIDKVWCSAHSGWRGGDPMCPCWRQPQVKPGYHIETFPNGTYIYRSNPLTGGGGTSTPKKEERVSEVTTLFEGYKCVDPEGCTIANCIVSHSELTRWAATATEFGLPVPDWVPAKLEAFKTTAKAKVLAEKKKLLADKKAKLAEMISREEKRKALRDEIAALEAELGGAPRE